MKEWERKSEGKNRSPWTTCIVFLSWYDPSLEYIFSSIVLFVSLESSTASAAVSVSPWMFCNQIEEKAEMSSTWNSSLILISPRKQMSNLFSFFFVHYRLIFHEHVLKLRLRFSLSLSRMQEEEEEGWDGKQENSEEKKREGERKSSLKGWDQSCNFLDQKWGHVLFVWWWVILGNHHPYSPSSYTFSVSPSVWFGSTCLEHEIRLSWT